MKKYKVLSGVMESGVVAVIRADSKEEAIAISEACVAGGINVIEITFTIKDAEVVIKELASYFSERPEVIIGAGTVLDEVTARIAIMAGAKFVVSPCFDEQTAKLCHLYQVPYMPGCMTITEIKNALEHGVDLIKLFPGDTLGPGFVKAVKAPLPQVNIMPTGGVNLNNVEQWIQNGCAAVGVGGNLIAPAKTGDYEKITEIASQYVVRVQRARGGLG
ncbi:bifunctional 4-hydroxy-2-oxoglutarate aldolase/2-dehydro-3-deoxy-phosphogluconate aldolase [Neobacillus rhizophilus]|uniref:Bifunctional 4-hydroxy-2-oxoglutarate aldolase/2-dehydro-3-deoxy-phosphogluconate aldolase n=1 Tax=Neobacillus rhizophilus TaxID=2833579 RepID=A0A942U1T7_9BACI|nr:bifunctional 4-hydroxy-2-oxoglutarate aldolase/2-dehydro-3-deoxy-phosphogluconate aldolase [Neobacillus rhizophilus]MBS4213010.1 bifunctional 4-hydroxy-2-oxoglutarate aldolase/2-dehydro-3-deoxy-phosphogluconate aldolase [Neobacillus rhizophilus]